MIDWKMQLTNPQLRQYEATGKHSGGYTSGRQGSIMDLSGPVALQVLREAIYDPPAAASAKAPSLWGLHAGNVYCFKWDNQQAWHGYRCEEQPPNGVLQSWRRNGTISEAEYGKLRRLPGRGH